MSCISELLRGKIRENSRPMKTWLSPGVLFKGQCRGKLLMLTRTRPVGICYCSPTLISWKTKWLGNRNEWPPQHRWWPPPLRLFAVGIWYQNLVQARGLLGSCSAVVRLLSWNRFCACSAEAKRSNAPTSQRCNTSPTSLPAVQTAVYLSWTQDQSRACYIVKAALLYNDSIHPHSDD